MILPYGASAGFSLRGDMRDVAAFYEIDWRKLHRVERNASQMTTLARHALFWKLTKVRGLTPGRVAQLLRCRANTVREGARLHDQRIKEFRATSGLERRG